MDDPKLIKLQKLLEAANEDYASQKEVTQIFLEIVRRFKDLDNTVSLKLYGVYGEVKKIISSATDDIDAKNEKLAQEFSKLKSIVSEIKPPATIDTKAIIDEAVRQAKEAFPEPVTIDTDSIISEALVKTRELIQPAMTAIETRDQLESLKGDQRLDISAIRGFGKKLSSFSENILNRAVSILDSRTSFLINKVNDLKSQVDVLSVGAYQVPVSGALGQSTFVWNIPPNVIVVDGVLRPKVSRDGTINWTGTTTTVLSIWPNEEIFAVA